jgi:hypothetical protein
LARIQKNDWGVRFEITVITATSTVDISAATSTAILFEDPNGSVSTKTASYTTDGTDGKMYWDSSTSFLSVSGAWKMQGRYGDANQTNRTEVTMFYVQPILE